MECDDSMHGNIERKMKHMDVTLPSGFLNVCQLARLTDPYKVQILTHSYFVYFENSI